MNAAYLLKLFFWFHVRYVRRHPGRAAAVVLGVALGAAVFTSVRIAMHASLDSFSRSMDRVAGAADLVVTRPGDFVPEEWVARLQAHEAVSAAAPFLSAYVQDDAQRVSPFLLIGIDPFLDVPFGRGLQGRGDGPAGRDLVTRPLTVLMTDRLASALGLTVGGRVRLRHPRGAATFHLAGILSGGGLAQVEGGQVAVTDIATFQEFSGLFGVVDRIDIKLRNPGKTSDIQALQGVLPPDLALDRPGRGKAAGQGLLRAYAANLSVLSFVSLFVGMFLVYSLVALNAASRRRETAILLSLGATGRTVFVLFVMEGAFFGLLGWFLSLPLGLPLVGWMVEGVGRTVSVLFVRVAPEQLALNPWELAVSFAGTILVSALAASQPAAEATKVSAKEALNRPAAAAPSQGTGRGPLVPALGLIASVWALSRLPAAGGVAYGGYAATFALFVGFALLSPFVLRLLGRSLAPVLSRFFGPPAHLAARSVGRSGTRLAVSVGSLLTAVALFVALTIMIHSFRNTVNAWVHQSVSGDLFVTPRLNEVNRHRNIFSQDQVAVLKSLARWADLVPFRRFYLLHGDLPYQFEVTQFDRLLRHGGYLWVRGDPDEARRRLLDGSGCIVSEVFANKTGRSVGDRFRDRVAGLEVDLPIVGVVRDYRSQGGVVFFSLARFRQMRRTAGLLSRQEEWSGARFFVPKGEEAPDAVLDRIKRTLFEKLGDRVSFIEGRQLRRRILHIFDETFAVTFVLLFIALVVAALGIATTLAVSILERSVELNTLHALGGSEGQIRSILGWEAALLVTTGEGLGLLCGLILSVLLVYGINRQSFGWTFVYEVNGATLLWALPLIFVAALAASLPVLKLVLRPSPATLLREP
ncbi:putative ABC transport system permease protein [Desulfacinum hydrothermale DSM 13146]|uniref:Putative ABC transport system permease protein n=1 Tax=Desulfacinum hydrothermale DSM 13146 TaxID=1121390 RepID=A0A1W1X8T6_9BACT|nr:ABC transporter permease [Desulfacinum hydrothermale]SMC20237.1 putative ABC transport system permease protein [Desulfacinum hydrothermale DSM 13146]